MLWPVSSAEKDGLGRSPPVRRDVIGDAPKIVPDLVIILRRHGLAILPQDRRAAVVKIFAIGRPRRTGFEPVLVRQLLGRRALAGLDSIADQRRPSALRAARKAVNANQLRPKAGRINPCLARVYRSTKSLYRQDFS